MEDKFFRWKKGLSRSSQAAFGKLASLFRTGDLSREDIDELEAMLIKSDMGVEMTSEVIDSLIKKAREIKPDKEEIHRLLEAELLSRVSAPPILEFPSIPSVILIVGINGSGKTTSVAKLANYYSKIGKQTLLVGADTFRAAANEQLSIWGERLRVPVIIGQIGSDPGAVTYDGIRSAISKEIDLVLVDTAGRLHTRNNLMEELEKIKRVAGKALPGAPHAVWLVLDATTGQNALTQIKSFVDFVGVTGIILSKLDSSARGGMVFAIQRALALPILFAGMGEGLEDLTLFDPLAFVEGILDIQKAH